MNMVDAGSSDGEWLSELHPDLRGRVASLAINTPPPITSNLARLADGRFVLVWWDVPKRLYRWATISAEEAREMAEPMRRFRGLSNWLEIFGEPATPKPEAPPVLTEQQRAVYDLIVRDGPLSGKEIAHRLVVSESTVTTHYIPALKLHGIQVKKGLGCYHPDHYPKR
jgi:biotin operon repressor